MNHLKVSLPAPLTGVERGRNEVESPPRLPVRERGEPPPTVPGGAASEQALQGLAGDIAKLALAMQTRDRLAQSEAARVGVELGTAVAERLVGEALAANRQGLGRALLTALERMQPARQVVVRGHADDMKVLEKQLAEHAGLERYRQLLVLQPDDDCERGQWKLEADDWFMEWDAARSLAE